MKIRFQNDSKLSVRFSSRSPFSLKVTFSNESGKISIEWVDSHPTLTRSLESSAIELLVFNACLMSAIELSTMECDNI